MKTTESDKATPPGWFEPNACDACAGTGNRVTGTTRTSKGKLASVSFSLTDPCPSCGGTGFAKAEPAP